MITLYRFPYSCYALKVQFLLDHLQLPYETKDVSFSDRDELIEVTGGRVTVPALVHDGNVVVESRDIFQYLLTLTKNDLVPEGMEAAVWAYLDWTDSLLEDVLFRIASPGIAAQMVRPTDRQLFIFIKERKFGTGCVTQWERSRKELIDTAKVLLAPTLETLSQADYVVGKRLTIADISLAGHLAMVEYADPALLPAISPDLLLFLSRLRNR